MTTQTAFREALLDGAQPVPDGLTDGAGRPAGRRYAVYRNNVAVALREALETGFPACVSLIGAENFAKVAGLYLRQSPPASPLMMHYGADFPAFLAEFPPLQHIGYLADIARLELAMRHSYHAADATPLDPTRLQGLSEEALMSAQLVLAPATRLIRTPWPLLQIYRFATVPGSPKPQATPEDVLITRTEFDPQPHALPPGGGAFVAALAAGQPFGAAMDAAGDDFDLPATLSLLLTQGALTDLKTA